MAMGNAFNQRSHSENHLYYLSNPVDPKKWAFLVFPPSRENILKYLNRSNVVSLEWKVEYSHFRPDEVFAILACFAILYNHTASRLLKDAHRLMAAGAFGVAEAQNANTPHRSGNFLEVTAAACISLATHCDSDDLFSITGVDGALFIQNLIKQLIVVDDFDALESIVNVNYPAVTDANRDSVFDLKSFLLASRFPFIYGWNHEIKYFDALNCSEDVFIKPFIRCENNEQIDGRFDALINGQNKKVVVECKNYESTISTTKLIAILEKCLATKDVGLSLVFGTQFSKTSQPVPIPTIQTTEIDVEKLISESEPVVKIVVKRASTEPSATVVKFKAAESKLVEFCNKKQINVYRVIPGESINYASTRLTFDIVPFEPGFRIHPNPELVCILFEDNCINSSIKP